MIKPDYSRHKKRADSSPLFNKNFEAKILDKSEWKQFNRTKTLGDIIWYSDESKTASEFYEKKLDYISLP
mgnify:CR=1 FL=1